VAYALLAHPVAQREMDALPPDIAEGIRRVLRAFAGNPRSDRFDVKPLRAIKGEPPALRLRVGEYRDILRVYPDGQEIRIARIGHRKNVYRGITGIGD